MTNFSIAAIMNNRRNAEEFEENEIESKRRKLIVESMPNNNLGKFFDKTKFFQLFVSLPYFIRRDGNELLQFHYYTYFKNTGFLCYSR